MTQQQLISIVVPIYNESANIPLIYRAVASLTKSLPYGFEFIFVDDGSEDNSVKEVNQLAKNDRRVKLVEFARNFGKEAAVSAGLHQSEGDAVVILDADLQHPPELIPKFIDRWRNGADVVIGVRRYGRDEGWFKRLSSKLFYKILGAIATTKVTPHASDFRLLDKCVVEAFNNMTERNRMTRGLIDWLGFKRDYVNFTSPIRIHGTRRYSFKKLWGLAISSLTAHSLFPLKLAGYLGVIILLITGPLGLFIYIEKYVLSDPYGFRFTGTAMLAVMLLFLVGVMLGCLGLISLYIGHIHAEVTNRPLYVTRKRGNQLDMEEG